MSQGIGKCAYCKQRTVLTKDHIRLRRDGFGDKLPCGSRNIKLVCARCNNIRASAGDCTAVAIMAFQLGWEVGMKPRHILAAWGCIGGLCKRRDAAAKLAALASQRRSIEARR